MSYRTLIPSLKTEQYTEWLLDGGYLPSSVIRLGIRQQLRERVALIASTSRELAYERKMRYVQALRNRPIAIETDAANTQHYEVGTGVLQACLGPRMKYRFGFPFLNYWRSQNGG